MFSVVLTSVSTSFESSIWVDSDYAVTPGSFWLHGLLKKWPRRMAEKPVLPGTPGTPTGPTLSAFKGLLPFNVGDMQEDVCRWIKLMSTT